jgi:predicted ATP-dependent serine protease
MAQQNLGWECPKCGRVYSPYTTKCSHCPQYIQVSSTASTSISNSHLFEKDETTSQCKICGLPEFIHPLHKKTK